MVFYPKNSIKNEAFEKVLHILEQQTFLLPKDYENLILRTSIQQRMYYSLQDNIFAYVHLLEQDSKEVNALAREIIACDKKASHNQFYNTLFHNSSEGVVLYDIKRRIILDVNQTACEIFGYPKKEFLKLQLSSLLDRFLEQTSAAGMFENMIHQLTLGCEFSYDCEYIRKSGDIFPATISLLPIASGKQYNAWVMIKDLSKIIKREPLIKESKAGFQSIFRMNPLGIFVTNSNGVIVDINESFSRIFGYTAAELIGESYTNLQPQPFTKEIRRQLQRLLEGDLDILETQKKYKKKDGSLFTCKIWVKVLKKNGSVFFITCIQDITEQYEREIEIKEREEKYVALFNNSLEGIVVIDFTENKAIDINPMGVKLFGSTKKELLVSSMPDQSPPFQPDGQRSSEKLRDILTTLKKELKEVRFEWRFKRTNSGELFDAIVTLSPITLRGENAAVMFVNDLTEEKEAQQKIDKHIRELDKKNKQLQHYIKSNLELESFAYVASHDLKQPLRSIASFTQLLQRRYKHLFDENAEDYMKFILDSTYNMDLLIKDLLAYSKVNTSELNVEEIPLHDLVSNLAESYRIPGDNVRIELDNLPTSIMGNESKLRQIFQNLISNGIKFNKKGTDSIIKVSCKDLEDVYSFAVEDNGIGIEKQYMEKIFLVFQRLHNKTEYEGSGIGLAICKKIVEQHAGEIWLESEFGKGSTFHFTIKKDLEKLVQS